MWTQASGEWLMLWNDDAIMETKDWDLEIGKYDDECSLLKFNPNNPNTTHYAHYFRYRRLVQTNWKL